LHTILDYEEAKMDGSKRGRSDRGVKAEMFNPGSDRNQVRSGPVLPSSLTRRGFLRRAGVAAAAVGTAAGTPSLLANASESTPEVAEINSNTSLLGVVGGHKRRARALQIRLNAALAEYGVPIPRHINNGDESLYPNRIGNFSKALPHNAIGEVDDDAHGSLLTAVSSGSPSDFAKIPLGGNTKMPSPQGALAFALVGVDSGQLSVPPAPTLASPERAGEMVELYWMALARDIPFSLYGHEPITAAAISELNRLTDFRGPKVHGRVTPDTLFRGETSAGQPGPFLSQFLLLPVSFGALPVTQKYSTYQPALDYLTDLPSFLACQNGQGPFPLNVVSGTSYIKNGRDISSFFHLDIAYQAYLTAAQWLLGNNAPLNPGNPYLQLTNQRPTITFGNQHIVTLLAQVGIESYKAVWYQKWIVHRTVRPEEYGGLVHNTVTGVAKYPLHEDVLNSRALSRIFSKYGAYLLPQAFPEGCPFHPSYTQGHGTIAGACVTALKAFFDPKFVIPNPVMPTDDGQTLLPYTGADAGQITVGSELNKLAGNIVIGRGMTGIHWRSDAVQALRLGEAVAISILRDQRPIFNEPFSGFTFTKFDGCTVAV
jgi:hypothetical protein